MQTLFTVTYEGRTYEVEFANVEGRGWYSTIYRITSAGKRGLKIQRTRAVGSIVGNMAYQLFKAELAK